MGAILSTPGVDSLGTHHFKHKGSDRETIAECVSVDFRRVLRSSSFRPGGNLDRWRESLHALVALYNTCLPNITPELLYSTVCTKDARSLLLVMSPEMALEDLCFRHGTRSIMDEKVAAGSSTVRSATGSPFTTADADSSSEDNRGGKGDMVEPCDAESSKPSKSDVDNEWQQVEYTEEEEEAAQEVCPNCRKSKYADVYSDESENGSSEDESESETSSEENSSDDEEQYIAGADAFLESVHTRRAQRQKNIDSRIGLALDHIGIENRLFAAVTFEKRKFDEEKISYLTVLSVRKRFRGLKLGKFLVQLVIKLSGNNDPLVVLADDDAIEFFEKQGFTNDPMICCKYDSLKKEGSWTNCTVMVRTPKLIPETKLGIQQVAMTDIEKIVNEKVEKWQKDTMLLYQQQVSLINQLKHEIISGRERILEQQEIIKYLTDELDKKFSNENNSASSSKMVEITKNDVTKIQQEIERLNLDSAIKDVTQIATENKENPISMRGDFSNEYIVVTPVTERHRDEKDDISSPPEVSLMEDSKSDLTSEEASLDLHTQLKQVQDLFDSSLKTSNPELFHRTKVVNIHSIGPDENHKLCNSESEWRQLFFCGSILTLSDISGIREKAKFSKYNFTYGDYGIGLYFSRFSEVAMKFSKLNCVLVAAVDPGKQTSTVIRDPKRSNAGENFDSLLTPGRLSGAIASPREGDTFKEKCQELIIFEETKAVPLFVIEYIVN